MQNAEADEVKRLMGRRTVSTLGFAALLLSGCGVNLPAEYPLAEYTRVQLLGKGESADKLALPPDVHATIGKTLRKEFGDPRDPSMLPTYMTKAEADRTFRGSLLYQKHCIHCHGLDGGGNGPTAAFLYPRPRDYRRGVFKWKSTEPNAKPTRDDLRRLLRDGAMGSSMPPFRLLPEDQLEELISYVIFLSKRGEFERRLLIRYASDEELPEPDEQLEMLAQIDTDWTAAAGQVTEPRSPRPIYEYGTEDYEASLQRATKLFLGDKAACYKCHNKDGKANPKDIVKTELEKMVDDWGFPNYPRNLTLGMYRGGRRPIDLYRRVFNGIKGTGMPAGGTNLKDDQIWDLVNLIRAIPYRPDLLPAEKKPTTHGHGAGD